MDDAELVRQGLVRIAARKQQIAALRQELARLAGSKRGIKSPHKAEQMGLAWYKLHEAIYMLRLLQQSLRKLKQQQHGDAQALRCASSAHPYMPR